MNDLDQSAAGFGARPNRRKLNREDFFLIGDLLPLADLLVFLLAAYLAAAVSAHSFATATELWRETLRASLAGVLLAPLMLRDRSWAARASGGRIAALLRFFLLRYLMWGGAVLAIARISPAPAALPSHWLALWLGGCLLISGEIRLLLLLGMLRLERTGVLREAIAVVGAGPAADRLIEHLQRTRGDGVAILGVFDDRRSRDNELQHRANGSIADLIELGKSQTLDWILLAIPGSSENRLQSLVQHMKALAVPIGLCPQGFGFTAATSAPRFIDEALPVTLLADRPKSLLDAAGAALESVLPRWIVTMLGLPLQLLRFVFVGGGSRSRRVPALRCALDDYDLDGFLDVAAHFGENRFGYVVTPNADHLIRLHREISFRALYDDADYVLLDSRFVARLLRLTRNLRLPVCTGSDLTSRLFESVIQYNDRIVLIGGSEEQAARLRRRYGLMQLAHFNPPMGFIHDPDAVQDCLRFIEAHSPFRYCLLAVGAPQQEMLAHLLKARGIARGMALCVGASINFLTGDEQRAPLWMQRHALEWLFRLLQAPRRMAARYLLRGPRIFALLQHTDIVRRSHDPASRDRKAAPALARISADALPQRSKAA